MTYALFDTAQNTIVQRFGGSLPGRLDWGNGSQVSPVSVGMQNGDLLVVTVVDNDTAPDRWSTDTGGRSYALTGTEVTVTRSYAKTRAPDVQMVKAEAESRILARYPIDKQLNAYSDFMLAREYIAGGGTLSDAQQTRYNDIKAAWAWIQSVRTASNEIEAMAPIPDDYDADVRWPV